MLSTSRHSVRQVTVLRARLLSPLGGRYKSSSLESYAEAPSDKEETSSSGACHPYVFPFDEDGNAGAEVINFPAVDRNSPTYNTDIKPVLLNSKEHAVGYLSRILNARVYEAAIETDLQHAKNLSAVRCFLHESLFNLHILLVSLTYYRSFTPAAPQEYSLAQARRHATRLFLQDTGGLQQNGPPYQGGIGQGRCGMLGRQSCARRGHVGSHAGLSCRDCHAAGDSLHQGE